MDDRLLTLNENIKKLKVLSDSFEHESFLDLLILDDIQKAELITNHEELARYYSVIKDYIIKLQDDIESLLNN